VAQRDGLGERERRVRVVLGVQAPGELGLRLPSDLDGGEVNAERGSGDLTVGDGDGAGDGVRPATTSLLNPTKLSSTRKPTTEPAATSHVPSTGPTGGLLQSWEARAGMGPVGA
jgi:hypothetical protein